MACKKCGSDWTTDAGADCKSCPHCCKLKRCLARKKGLFVEPTQAKSCKECGVEFVAVGLSQIKRRFLCGSDQCKSSHDKRRKRASAKRRSKRACVVSRAPKANRSCALPGCGRKLLRKAQAKYCSRDCFHAAVKGGRQQFKGRVRDEWASFVDWAYDWEQQRPRPRKQRNRKSRPECQHCRNECNEGSKRFCSYACLKQWRGKRACRCGRAVCNATAFGRPVCSKCKRETRRRYKTMYGSYRKRCRAYGGLFNPDVRSIDVFIRDKWKCHICGLKTHKVFRVDDARSATVDHHPIPLSKGGDHDWHNVRCACFRCNSIKSDQWDGQARLPMQVVANP